MLAEVCFERELSFCISSVHKLCGGLAGFITLVHCVNILVVHHDSLIAYEVFVIISLFNLPFSWSEFTRFGCFLYFLGENCNLECLLQAINIEGLTLDKFLEQHVANSGWILEKGHGRGQLIVLPRNEFNHPELKKNSADAIPLEHVTRIFPILG